MSLKIALNRILRYILNIQTKNKTNKQYITTDKILALEGKNTPILIKYWQLKREIKGSSRKISIKEMKIKKIERRKVREIKIKNKKK